MAEKPKGECFPWRCHRRMMPRTWFLGAWGGSLRTSRSGVRRWGWADWGVMYQAQQPRSGFLGGDLKQHMAHLADVYVANGTNSRKNKKASVFRDGAMKVRDRELDFWDVFWEFRWCRWMAGFRRWGRWCKAEFCWLGVMYQAQNRERLQRTHISDN